MCHLQATRGTAITENPADRDESRPRTSLLRLRLLYAAVAVAGVTLDVITKTMAVRWLDPGDPVQLLGGLLRLQLVRNPGAAFSLGENFTPVFAVLSACVLAVVVIFLARRVGHTGWAVALGLVSAGVAGNLIDRIFREPGVLHGHVVDFLQLPYWPIFNVADMCITGAAILIIVLSVIKNIGLDGKRLAPTRRSGDDQAARDAPREPGPASTER
ncbi:signal peptidase II [Microlunatus speluncae]|uniref:signal peptidase II n=1 Tax=Microlunatus speluncae TaxID=2594267 RepID=UPI0024842AEA|nr:signal peptidase II [Microlunatus speluncae]